MDPDFVAQLVAHTRRMYVFLGTLIPFSADIDDVYQQTCIALWEKRHLYEPGRPFFPWACGFARNEALRYLRSARASKLRFGEATLEAIASFQEESTPTRAELRRAALEGCLQQLDGRQRHLLERCYTGDETIKGIAQDLGISAAALSMRLQRLRQALLGCIERRVTGVEGGA